MSHGDERVRQENPAVYLRVVASVIPREMKVETNRFEDLTDERLLAKIKVPDSRIRAELGDMPNRPAETTH